MSNLNATEHTYVSYIVHESEMARRERTEKRLWVIILVLIALLAGSNGAWIWYESQFIEEQWSFEANADDGGTAVANGRGDVSIYGNSESYD